MINLEINVPKTPLPKSMIHKIVVYADYENPILDKKFIVSIEKVDASEMPTAQDIIDKSMILTDKIAIQSEDK